MAGSLVSLASKTVTDVGAFLKESASSNSLKYSPEKGKTHLLYFPATKVVVKLDDGTEKETDGVVAVSGEVHEWLDSAGQYHATICMKDKIRYADDGKTMLNDGRCPICDRVDDAWNIYNYRKDMEDANCTLTGEPRKKHMETALQTFGDEKKAKKANYYMYILVVQFTANDNGEVKLDDKGLPEYTLKVARFSHSKTEKLTSLVNNAGGVLAGSEWAFQYGNDDSPKILAGQVTMSAVFPDRYVTKMYPDVLKSINEEVAKFDWDGLEDAFKEWKGMTTAETQKMMDDAFEEWDSYKERLKTDANAKYLEYSEVVPTSNPSLQIPAAPQISAVGTPNVPNVPNVPNIAGAVQEQTVQMPSMAGQVQAQPQVSNVTENGVPTMSEQQVNNAFQQAGNGITI